MLSNTKKRLISIFDTTLRDGEQAPKNSMTLDQKVEIALMLEDLGVNTIEAGFPSASLEDYSAVYEIASQVKKSKISALTRCKQADLDHAISALKPASDSQLEILTTVSDIHLKYKRDISREEALAEIVTSIRYAKDQGIANVRTLLEDATRADRQFLKTVIEAGLEAGATGIVIADTVGFCIVSELFELVSWVKKILPEVQVSVHCHNDLGLATANSLAGIEAGAEEVQVTLCGIGERAGNAALEEVVAALHLKSNHYQCKTTIDLTKLYLVAQKLLSHISHPPMRTKAIVGENSFATEAGIHQSGILKNPLTYEVLDPEWFGRTRKLVFGRHSGRSLIRHKLASLGLRAETNLVNRLYDEMTNNPDFTVLDNYSLKEYC